MLDLKVTGGSILDGLGGKPYVADVGIEGARFTEIGDLSEAEAAREVRADGKFVCPVFIDVHSLSDA